MSSALVVLVPEAEQLVAAVRARHDPLFEHDGQTLVAVTWRHDMTRIAVVKHLRVLESAGLVVSRRGGRGRRTTSTGYGSACSTIAG